MWFGSQKPWTPSGPGRSEGCRAMVEQRDTSGIEADDADMITLEEEFDRLAFEDDGSTAREILASGQSIPIVRDDTPHGHVIRIHPDGREELVKFDRESAAAILDR